MRFEEGGEHFESFEQQGSCVHRRRLFRRLRGLQNIFGGGANVVLVDIDEKYFERTAELRNQYGEDRVVTFIGTCTEQADMDEAIRFAVNHFGGVDILLNLAGFHGAGWVDAILPEQWDRAMDVTCTGHTGPPWLQCPI